MAESKQELYHEERLRDEADPKKSTELQRIYDKLEAEHVHAPQVTGAGGAPDKAAPGLMAGAMGRQAGQRMSQQGASAVTAPQAGGFNPIVSRSNPDPLHYGQMLDVGTALVGGVDTKIAGGMAEEATKGGVSKLIQKFMSARGATAAEKVANIAHETGMEVHTVAKAVEQELAKGAKDITGSLHDTAAEIKAARTPAEPKLGMKTGKTPAGRPARAQTIGPKSKVGTAAVRANKNVKVGNAKYKGGAKPSESAAKPHDTKSATPKKKGPTKRAAKKE